MLCIWLAHFSDAMTSIMISVFSSSVLLPPPPLCLCPTMDFHIERRRHTSTYDCLNLLFCPDEHEKNILGSSDSPINVKLAAATTGRACGRHLFQIHYPPCSWALSNSRTPRSRQNLLAFFNACPVPQALILSFCVGAQIRWVNCAHGLASFNGYERG